MRLQNVRPHLRLALLDRTLDTRRGFRFGSRANLNEVFSCVNWKAIALTWAR